MFMKKIRNLLIFFFLMAVCASSAFAADFSLGAFCSVADTLRGGFSANRMEDGELAPFDYTVPEDGVTLLIFYSNSCGNSRQVIRDLSCSTLAYDPRVDFVALECSDGSREDTEAFFQTNAGESADFFTVWYGRSSLCSLYADLIGHSGPITFPLVIAVKESGGSAQLGWASMGYQNPKVYSAAVEAVLSTDLTPSALSYTEQDGEITVTGFSQPQAHLVIPAEIDGYPVTRIGDYAFDYSIVETVSLPNTVTSIGYMAFYSCTYLSTVHLPESLEEISHYAFTHCDRLEQVTLPASLVTLGEKVFYDCDNLTEISVKEGNTAFRSEDHVLYTSDGSELIHYPGGKKDPVFVVPEGVTKIWDDAIAFAPLEELVLPNSLTEFTKLSLYACPNLTAFRVAESHPTLTVRDGLLYSRDGRTLLACPDNFTGSVSVPEGVEHIEDRAFSNCYMMLTLSLPSSLREIGWRAFGECMMLSRIDISEGLTTLGGEAFYCCINLEEVVLPASLQTVGNYCFYNSTVQELYFRGNAPSVNRFFNYTGYVYHTDTSSGWDVSPWTDCLLNSWDGSSLPLLTGTCSDYYNGSYSWTYDRNSDTLNLSGPSLLVPSHYFGSNVLQKYQYRIRHIALTETTEIAANVCASFPCLESIHLPATLETISDSAFNSAARPISVTMDSGNPYFTLKESILYSADQSRLIYAGGLEGKTSFTVMSGVETIDYYAFLNTRLTELTLPSNLGDSFFGLRAPTLERVEISGSAIFESVDGVLFRADKPWLAFCPNGRTGIYTIPEGTTTILKYAFAYSSLEEAIFPSSLYTVMPYAFSHASIRRAILGGEIDAVTDYAFSYSSVEEVECDARYVAQLAFRGCSALEKISLPKVSSLGSGVFYECTSLTDAYLGDRLITLPYDTFGNCTALTWFTIPKSVETVEEGAFRGCTAMERVYCPGYPYVFHDSFSDMGITPELLVDCTMGGNWWLLTGSEWGGCTVTDWTRPEYVAAQWTDNTLSVSMRGIGRAAPLFISFYDRDGRMLRCRVIEMEDGNLDIELPADTADIRIFVVGQQFEPIMPMIRPERT